MVSTLASGSSQHCVDYESVLCSAPLHTMPGSGPQLANKNKNLFDLLTFRKKRPTIYFIVTPRLQFLQLDHRVKNLLPIEFEKIGPPNGNGNCPPPSSPTKLPSTKWLKYLKLFKSYSINLKSWRLWADKKAATVLSWLDELLGLLQSFKKYLTSSIVTLWTRYVQTLLYKTLKKLETVVRYKRGHFSLPQLVNFWT